MIKNILIPMAGLGTRFKKNNFLTIKPLIKIDKNSILEESIAELPNAKRKIAIINKKIFDKYSILQKILRSSNIQNFLLKRNTLGQSDTCFKLKNTVANNEDVLIHSCDYVMKYSLMKFYKTIKKSDVIIFTYRLNSTIVRDYNDYAYCKVKSNKVIQIKEKKTLSKTPEKDQMIIGTFWFKKFKDFLLCHEDARKNKKFVNKELYIANNINYLIKKGRNVKIFEVDHWKNLGDFFSYKQYIYWKNFFRDQTDL